VLFFEEWFDAAHLLGEIVPGLSASPANKVWSAVLN
jgi:hypothetical protein